MLSHKIKNQFYKNPLKTIGVLLVCISAIFTIYISDFIWMSCIIQKCNFPVPETKVTRQYIDDNVLKGFRNKPETDTRKMANSIRRIVLSNQKNRRQVMVFMYYKHFQKIFQVAYDENVLFLGYDNLYD